jgi:hypothetical protein
VSAPAGGAGDASSSEREGAAVGATLWALFFLADPAGVGAGQQVKIVWRMTGSGAVSFVASGPDGRTVRPVWGPDTHGDSDWSRPGEEWGTGWVFPVRGQWTVRVTRAEQGTGRLTVQVR